MKIIIFFIFFIFCNKINSQKSVNPWIFSERDNLYNTLINSTNIPLFGQDNLNNCLYGLKIQLNWQHTSGRLLMDNGSDNININSWWGNMNYYLSVIPYLSAMKLNIVPAISISYNPDSSKFCTTYESCDQELMNEWDNFFQLILDTKNGVNKTVTTEREVLRIMWIAHTATIKHAQPIMESNTFKQLKIHERKFGDGWCYFVQVIAEVNFNTNDTNVSILGKNLPQRMLNKLTDIPPFITDMTKETNNIILAINMISDLSKNSLVWEGFIDLLQLATKNPECQDLINSEINNFLNSPIPTIIDTLFDIILNKC